MKNKDNEVIEDLISALADCLQWLENQDGVQILLAMKQKQATDIITNAHNAMTQARAYLSD